jgi:hypothetical protein
LITIVYEQLKKRDGDGTFFMNKMEQVCEECPTLKTTPNKTKWENKTLRCFCYHFRNAISHSHIRGNNDLTGKKWESITIWDERYDKNKGNKHKTFPETVLTYETVKELANYISNFYLEYLRKDLDEDNRKNLLFSLYPDNNVNINIEKAIRKNKFSDACKDLKQFE